MAKRLLILSTANSHQFIIVPQILNAKNGFYKAKGSLSFFFMYNLSTFNKSYLKLLVACFSVVFFYPKPWFL